jgi:Flp pilus assembly protein protease CpaA
MGGSALFLVYQDIREQTIPLSGLALFLVASLLKQVAEPDIEGLMVVAVLVSILLGCQGLFYLVKRKNVLGWGDLILGPGCGLWLHFQELPIFLLSTGIIALSMGVIWRYRWGMLAFPFAPALLFGLGVVFLIRCFLTVSGI